METVKRQLGAEGGQHDATLKPAPKSISGHDTASPDTNSKKSSFPVFHALFESGRTNNFDAMADTIADDCEWVIMSNMQKFEGKAACVELCKKGKLASDKTPEIIYDVATPEWGVFEYMNRGAITKDLSALAAIDSDFQLAKDPSTLV